MPEIGRPYRPAAAAPASRAQRATVARLIRAEASAQARYYADGGAEVLVLDTRGIITRIVSVDRDGKVVES